MHAAIPRAPTLGNFPWPRPTAAASVHLFLHSVPPMKNLVRSLVCLALVGSALVAAPATSAWKSLFNGKNLDGWRNPYTWGESKVVGDEVHLIADKKFFLVTEKSYSDFVFEVEILLPAGKANSGVMFRAQVQPNKVTGYQAEVDGDPVRLWSGGLYDEGRRMWFASPIKGDAASEKAFRDRAGSSFKRDGWNTYRITCQGQSIKIEVNGVVTTDIKDSMDASGPIGLQHHGEKGQTYKFRNARIREL